MKLSGFDYTLPKKLIAQHPLPKRDSSRLMVLNKKENSIAHDTFSNFPNYLNRGDLVVLNDTKVFPARLIGHKKKSGGKVEILLIREIGPGKWSCMMKSSGKLKEHTEITFSLNGLSALIIGKNNTENDAKDFDGQWLVQFNSRENLINFIEKDGLIPLPPYIKRDQDKPSSPEDRERYQTVYAAKSGAIAAPTAGLHFTEDTFKRIKEKGVDVAEITLHVGPGTFKPVKTEVIEGHLMDPEYYEISAISVQKIKKALEKNRRIITIGTTSTRTIEAIDFKSINVCNKRGCSNLFIYPGFQFKHMNGLLTNFHLPKSTLLMLVYAFAGKKLAKQAYKEAVRGKYRFYSYGDAMLIL